MVALNNPPEQLLASYRNRERNLTMSIENFKAELQHVRKRIEELKKEIRDGR